MSVTRAEAYALAIIAELVCADQSVAWLEDALCSRMGQALVADGYSPDQLFEVLVENITQSGVEDLAEQLGRSRLLMAAARIAPHPGVETLVEAVERLRRSAVGFPEDLIVSEPTSRALWSRDVYSLRFAIVAPFSASVGASDRWYLWDIDLCSGSPFTVGGGYFPTAEEAFAEWRAAVGPEAAGRSQLEPVTDADLAASFFPRASDNYYARESASQYAVVDLLNGSKAYVLAVIEHVNRRVRVLGATFHPTADWVTQQARNLLMDLEDAEARVNYLIHDRDASFGAAFDMVFTAAGIDVIRTGVRAPRQNAIMERWFRSLRAELTDRILIWNLDHLTRLLREYEGQYNGHRPHRSLGQAAPTRPRPDNVVDLEEFRVRRRDRAGGPLHEYQQVA